MPGTIRWWPGRSRVSGRRNSCWCLVSALAGQSEAPADPLPASAGTWRGAGDFRKVRPRCPGDSWREDGVSIRRVGPFPGPAATWPRSLEIHRRTNLRKPGYRWARAGRLSRGAEARSRLRHPAWGRPTRPRMRTPKATLRRVFRHPASHRHHLHRLAQMRQSRPAVHVSRSRKVGGRISEADECCIRCLGRLTRCGQGRCRTAVSARGSLCRPRPLPIPRCHLWAEAGAWSLVGR